MQQKHTNFSRKRNQRYSGSSACLVCQRISTWDWGPLVVAGAVLTVPDDQNDRTHNGDQVQQIPGAGSPDVVQTANTDSDRGNQSGKAPEPGKALRDHAGGHTGKGAEQECPPILASSGTGVEVRVLGEEHLDGINEADGRLRLPAIGVGDIAAIDLPRAAPVAELCAVWQLLAAILTI